MNKYEKKISELQSRIQRIRNGQKDVVKKFAEELEFSALCAKSDKEYYEAEIERAKKLLEFAAHYANAGGDDNGSMLAMQIETFLNPPVIS